MIGSKQGAKPAAGNEMFSWVFHARFKMLSRSCASLSRVALRFLLSRPPCAKTLTWKKRRRGQSLLNQPQINKTLMKLPNLFFIGYLASWILATRNALTAKVRHLWAWRVSAILLTVGLASLFAARRIGSSIDKDGFLHEPFFLIGSGSLLSLTGMCLTFALLLRGLFSKKAAQSDQR